jgi:hypothetical protein
VSRDYEGTLAAVWAHRRVFPADPEVFFPDRDGPGPLTEALEQNRLSFVLPLGVDSRGTLQGYLEFLGVPYGGCGLTGVLLAGDPGLGRAVLGSMGLVWEEESRSAGVLVGVVGNESPVAGAPVGAEGVVQGRPDLTALALKVYQGFGLGGWALVGLSLSGAGWHTVSSSPGLEPDGAFLGSLEPVGLDLDQILRRVVADGQARHDGEVGLQTVYKDRI